MKSNIPEELQKIVSDIKAREHEEFLQIKLEVTKKKKGDWDVKIGDPIPYFDKRLSYELTGYKPITETEGLDFDPSWFTEARDTFIKTKKYCSYLRGSKAYRDFWNTQYKRCREGYTVNGYTLTGFNYYFLNFYQLPSTDTEVAGSSRERIFPKFFVYQYEFFHYFELCRHLKLNLAEMKNRGCGMSEINASIFDNFFNCFKNSICLLTAFDLKYVIKTLDKIWDGITFTDDNTDGGMFKLRQVTDTQFKKVASWYKVVNGQKIETGWGSQIEGIVVDKDRKMRGDRVGFLFLEESGSNPILAKTFTKAEELVTVSGNKIGIIAAIGTGGDSGAALEGLRRVYYNPEVFKVLPFYHNYTEDGGWVKTGYFIPAYISMNKAGYVGSRGEYIISKQKAYYEAIRADKAADPKALLDFIAEQCFTAEEAFAAEGENKFNKMLVAELLTRIRAFKECPPIDKGYFTFSYKAGFPRRVEGPNIKDIVWHSDNKFQKIKILEHPVWTPVYETKEKKRIEKLIENGEDIEPYTSISMLRGLYVIGVDGIDIGLAQTSETTKEPSDFCAVVLKRQFGMKDPCLVAIYKDRPQDIRECYQLTIALAMYYNCGINIEATRMSFVNWAKSSKLLNYFMKRPRATYPDINKIKSTQYGSPATVMVIEHLTDLIRDFLEDYYYTIWFEEALVELERYTDENKRKFDIIAAWGMAMLADEELQSISIKPVQQDDNTFLNVGYYFDENGYRRFGIIPNKNKNNLTYNPNYYDDDTGGVRTSNPRVYYQGDW